MSIGDLQQEVRTSLVERLRLDLLGPATPDEVLRQDRETREGDTPLSRYLLGILYPAGSLVAPEEDDSANDGIDDEENDTPEALIAITGIPKPSSIGLSFAVAEQVKELFLEFRYGLYTPTELALPSARDRTGEGRGEGKRKRPTILWTRTQVVRPVSLTLPDTGALSLPGGGKGEWFCRRDGNLVVASIFLRNINPAGSGSDKPEQCLYQPTIVVKGGTPESAPFVNRAYQGSPGIDDPDLESYRLLYRDRPEFGVGHGCAVVWDSRECPADRARMLCTELLPDHEVSMTEARGGIGLPGLNMACLATAKSGNEIKSTLTPLVDQYEEWIRDQAREVPHLASVLHPQAREHLADCQKAIGRLRAGLDLIATDPLVLKAFQFANHAMMLQRQKAVEAANFQKGKDRVFDAEPPAWRPFQIAFILLNLTGIAVPDSDDRDIVDLLWFPTGGGKTEAYLGLAAFTMGLRRFRHAETPCQDASGDGGVTVLMRYTLRLLTIQQFQRAATLLCACETLRRQNPAQLGYEPFSIALWVGGGATPNSIDQRPDPQHGREPGALQALSNFDPNNEPAEGNPVQLRACPWCGESLSHRDYTASKELLHLQIRCPNEHCDFHGAASDLTSGIPAYIVDEDIYLRCPTMLIGTVDKVARLPWDDRTRALFGYVDRRCLRHGFLAKGMNYEGKCGGRHYPRGNLPATAPPRAVSPFLPPELIIQDELHLISGPLGSLMGLYESAVDFLCSHTGHRPKIVASTATIRRYQDQIRGLFDREARQFPPPGLIAGESFFTAEDRTRPGRIYVGLCAPGKSMKTAAVRVLASLLHSAELERQTRAAAVVDPYWTVVYYFNSLRELGGALRLVDDDIRQRLVYLAHADGTSPPRTPERRPELTSRIPAKEITTLLKQMEQTLQTGTALDVLLCTNMISVGVDIQRFGLMLVTGQPRSSSEYIQATSRVGRQVPGVILTLYNWSRPRDLSHYEYFVPYHSMMYRHVEASSVTPYSSRARDKAIHAVFVSLLRLLDARMSGNTGAQNFDPGDPLVRQVTAYLLDRVTRNNPDELADARDQLQAFIDGWVEQRERHRTDLKYRAPGRIGPDIPRTWLLQSAEEGQEEEFPRGTLNSLRQVEKPAGLYFKNFWRSGIPRTHP
ncbi:hypothetical protein NKDENANG_02776 [Candidatus Entotheonellaceae bacterium PAL068K]